MKWSGFKKKEVAKDKHINYKVYLKSGLVIKAIASLPSEKTLASNLVNIMDIGGWFYIVLEDGRRQLLNADEVGTIIVDGVK